VRTNSPNTTPPPAPRKRGRPPSPASRERILDAALRLFAEQGYADTSVADVQSACGLSSGSGALYKHFPSKQALLEAGIERELVHLEGVRLARRMFADVFDFRSELEVLGRFVLMELDAERDVLRILLKDADRFPKLLAAARTKLLEPMYEVFSDWMRGHLHAGHIDVDDVDATAAVALGAIIQYRASEVLLGGPPPGMDEERFLQAWARIVGGLVRQP
jgi:AcrR family transcriptional regulator